MKKFKNIVAFVLVLVMISSFAFADMKFKDVADNHWAIPFIEKMAGLGIVKGYEDGRFGPNDAVNKYVAVLVTYRTLDSQGLINADDKAVLKNRYASVIKEYQVPNWDGLHEAVGFFIENKIIEENDLKNFSSKGVNLDISRQQMALYLGKALNIYFKDDVNQVITPVFKDHAKIEYDNLKYVNVLNRHGIIAGDENNNFNPLKSLNRAELSKILATSVEELKKVSAVKDEIIQAVVQVKLDDTKHIVFYNRDSKTDVRKEKIGDNIKITINGNDAKYEDLTLDLIVELSYKNSKLVSITANNVKKELTFQNGTVSDILGTEGNKFLYLKDNTSKVFVYKISPDVKVTNDGIAANLSAVYSGDTVKIGITGDVVYELDFKKKEQELKGTFESISVDGTPKLNISIQGISKTFAIKSDAVVTRNTQRKTLGDLVQGDEIKIALKFDEVISIDANGVVGKEVGYISQITQGITNKITIKDVNGNEATYEMGKNAKIYVDNEVKTAFDLRINFKVEAKIESATIVELKAKTTIDKLYKVGMITTKYDDLKVLVIKSDDGVDYTINIKPDTIFIDNSGNRTAFNSMKREQIIFAFGIMQDKIMSADKVIVLSTGN